MPDAPPAGAIAAPAPAASAPAGTPGGQQAPAWLESVDPDLRSSFSQYATVNDALKAHNELRTKLSQKAEPTGSGDLSIAAPTKPDGTIADPTTFVKSIGLDPLEIAKQWNEKGELTHEQYVKFEKKGIPRTLVDHQLRLEQQNRQFVAAKIKNEAAAIVGGEQQLTTLLEWARQDGSISAEDREWANRQLADPVSAPRIVEWLNQRYTKAVGSNGAQRQIEGNSAAQISREPITSRRELLTLTNSKDYVEGTDYFKRVQARIAATPNIGALI